jgi:hypothetical protein
MAVTPSRARPQTRIEKGISLARGPALVLGTVLLIAGLYFLYKQHTFLKFSNFPDGKAPADGKVFLGIFGANGWTGMLTAAAGGLLLFGAAQHLLAKTMSLIVGVALGAAAIIALVSGDVLGMAAANHWTELAWGGVAVILLFNTLAPRRKREVPVAVDDGALASGDRTVATRREPVAAAEGPVARHEDRVAARDEEPVAARNGRTVAGNGNGNGSLAADQAAARQEPATAETTTRRDAST